MLSTETWNRFGLPATFAVTTILSTVAIMFSFLSLSDLAAGFISLSVVYLLITVQIYAFCRALKLVAGWFFMFILGNYLSDVEVGSLWAFTILVVFEINSIRIAQKAKQL